VPEGERLAILGRSGAGKSTLLNCLHGQCARDAALVPQAAALVRNLSVFHNVYMGRLDRNSTAHNLRMLVWPGRQEKDEIADILDVVGLGDKMFEMAGRLSGGQQQRVSVARALYNGRPIVIGDEPLSALDRIQGETILRQMIDRARTLVLAMHDLPLALAYATRVLVIDDGRIALDAPAAGLRPGDIAPYYARIAP
jgi:phosphonate transport system ATP-binding protein